MKQTSQTDKAISDKPVILLAFANAKKNPLKIHKERIELVKALVESERETELKDEEIKQHYQTDLCELVVLKEASIQKIVDTFLDNKYQDKTGKRSRISVFHYAGHAGDDALLLESTQGGGETKKAYDQGLISLFREIGKQGMLKFVFLNGCSSQKITDGFLGVGIPAVLGTTKSIQDSIATDLSRQFYRGIGEGNSIIRSWNMAEAQIRTYFNEDSNLSYRPTIFNREADLPDVFPWQIKFADGADHQGVRGWNLPDASNNPLHNLPLNKDENYYDYLADSPYKGLNYFRKKDAALFFGRGAEIRALHNQIHEKRPVILFHGKSGVGKSSLLFAGLIPRIQTHFPVYKRRDQEKGLLDSLHEAFDDKLTTNWGNSTPDLIEKWIALEKQEGKAVLILLDQVEEIYTRAVPQAEAAKGDQELFAFLEAIQKFWREGNSGIKGKIIFSFRKEYFAEISRIFQQDNIAYTDILLESLKRPGVIEAIKGVEAPKLQKKYKLIFELGLAEEIADDLLADADSSVAPILQIVLRKLWDNHGADPSPEKRETLTIKKANYRKGISKNMEDFFYAQIESFKKQDTGPLSKGGNGFKEMAENGLLYEILFLHTTQLGTATSCHVHNMHNLFYLKRKELDTALKALEKLYLLVELKAGDKKVTLLAHDTLAPIVRRIHENSDQDAQRACRILFGKMRNVCYWFPEKPEKDLLVFGDQKDQFIKRNRNYDLFRERARKAYAGPDFESFWEEAVKRMNCDFNDHLENMLLTAPDIQTIERGKKGMRRWSKWENMLIQASKDQIAAREAKEKQLIAEGQYNLALAYESQATRMIEEANKSKNASYREMAWLYSLHALSQEYPKEKSLPLSIDRVVRANLAAGPYRNLWKAPLFPELAFTFLKGFTEDFRLFITDVEENRNSRVLDLEKGKVKFELEGTPLAYASNGKFLLLSRKNVERKYDAIIVDLEGNEEIDRFTLGVNFSLEVAFHPSGQFIAFIKNGIPYVRVFGQKNLRIKYAANKEEKLNLEKLSFSPKGDTLALCDTKNQIYVFDLMPSTAEIKDLHLLNSPKIYALPTATYMSDILISNGGSYLIAAVNEEDYNCKLLFFDLQTKALKAEEIPTYSSMHDRPMVLSKENQLFAYCSAYELISLIDFSKDQFPIIAELTSKTDLFANNIGALQFDKEGKQLASATRNGEINIWRVLADAADWHIGPDFYQSSLALSSQPAKVYFPIEKGIAIWNYNWDKEEGIIHFTEQGIEECDIMRMELSQGGVLAAVLQAPTDAQRGHAEKKLVLYDLKQSLNPVGKIIDLEPQSSNKLAFSPDGQWIAHGGKESELVLRKVQSSSTHILLGPKTDKALSCISFDPSGKFLAAGWPDGNIYIWALPEELNEQRLGQIEMPKLLEAASEDLHSILISGDQVITSSSEGIQLRNLKQDKLIEFEKELANYCEGMALMANGKILISFHRDPIIRFWDLETQKILHQMKVHGPEFGGFVAFNLDEKQKVLAFSAGESGSLDFVNLEFLSDYLLHRKEGELFKKIYKKSFMHLSYLMEGIELKAVARRRVNYKKEKDLQKERMLVESHPWQFLSQ